MENHSLLKELVLSYIYYLLAMNSSNENLIYSQQKNLDCKKKNRDRNQSQFASLGPSVVYVFKAKFGSCYKNDNNKLKRTFLQSSMEQCGNKSLTHAQDKAEANVIRVGNNKLNQFLFHKTNISGFFLSNGYTVLYIIHYLTRFSYSTQKAGTHMSKRNCSAARLPL